ncbi:hypothetical protein APHAL10511_001514 [Amanita phalloides]|nr:hypothetical protein APHAL10511_001514 [Amanita phalloides]
MLSHCLGQRFYGTEQFPRVLGRPRSGLRTTLDPLKLGRQDFVDISNRRARIIRFKDVPDNISSIDCYPSRFPLNASGFLYYHVPPPHLPPIMGQLRFRVTRDSDPSSFSRGSDLTLPNKPLFPWGVPLLLLPWASQFKSISQQLLLDRLVTSELLQRCKQMWKNHATGIIRQGRFRRFLYYLDQPFFWRFDTTNFYILVWAVCEDRFVRCRIPNPFKTGTRARIAGSAKVQLVRLGENTIGLRILKFVDPPYVVDVRALEAWMEVPVEGELLRRRGEFYTMDIDADEARALQQLKSLET